MLLHQDIRRWQDSLVPWSGGLLHTFLLALHLLALGGLSGSIGILVPQLVVGLGRDVDGSLGLTS